MSNVHSGVKVLAIISESQVWYKIYLYIGSKPQSFVKALHEAISILSLQLFKLSLKWSSTEVCSCYLRLTLNPWFVCIATGDFSCLFFTVKARYVRGATGLIS